MENNPPGNEILRHYHFFSKTDAGFNWLARSIAVNGGKGSSGYYHILKGWSRPYPETTGYIISTYLDYYKCFPDRKYLKPALDLGKWLIELYANKQFFPGGIELNNRPLVFDSAQILQGLTSLYDITKDPYYKDTVIKTFEWLIETISDSEKWLGRSLAQGFIPAYHSRMIWILLDTANSLDLKLSGKYNFLNQFIDDLMDRSSAQGWLENYGIELNRPVGTHFIAYTLQGILEYGVLTNNRRHLQWVRKAGDRVMNTIRENMMLAGQFYPEWNADTRFTCPVGNAQFSLLFGRLFELTEEPDYYKTAVFLLNRVAKRQSRFISNGGIPGSHPIWGPYQRFKFPNWAVKFFLDAYLKLFMIRGNIKVQVNGL